MTCQELCDRFGLTATCCPSCHYDDDDGLQPLGVVVIGDEEHPACCTVVAAYRERTEPTTPTSVPPQGGSE